MQMSIRDVCNRNVVTVQANSTLVEASQKMSQNHVGSLVVIESYNGRRIPVGIVTDRDLALSLSSSPDPRQLKVSQIMRSRPITVRLTDGVFESIELMERSGIKRLPVVDESGELAGIVCADDMASLVSQESAKLAKITEIQTKKEAGLRYPLKVEPRFQL
jgi:signal-transduction protein with cAMP-binding, CBS, and nucleotidyltransferase domain